MVQLNPLLTISWQEAEEKFADANSDIRLMIVPNQVPGLDYTATPAKELTDVPDCPMCAPPFVAGTIAIASATLSGGLVQTAPTYEASLPPHGLLARPCAKLPGAGSRWGFSGVLGAGPRSVSGLQLLRSQSACRHIQRPQGPRPSFLQT